jgi:hypothetical protein
MGELRLGDLEFEWDDAKARSNLSKHGVSFLEAASVFQDAWGLLIHDPMHSEAEERFVLIGMSAEQRILAVVNVERRERLRIISAREAVVRERRVYEQAKLGR